MSSMRLKTRYVLTVLAAGLLVTGAVAITILSSEYHEERHIEELLEQAGRAGETDAAAGLASLRRELASLQQHAYSARLPLVVAGGALLSLLAAWITSLMVRRIDRAMGALMDTADRIGRGFQSAPVRPIGVREIAALEDALERMRQALLGRQLKLPRAASRLCRQRRIFGAGTVR